ncbi:coiled-coil domain-containing protein [Saccharibacter floricola]|uniref:Chromosome partition protein Smc n=1 Tax=Saccharibacter floricola DSM 15669 TaxID=1123227 RepID=A0ABQ0NWD0_9PROT|nr:AAA family ATPase [Saccharibacter floricola]GBQ04810.1 chromosome segregation protein SMC [Saccharibacter floricola DSM 15669]
MTQHRATITRLDIAGFKSFADDVHLDILPGLTGIVGPNGCGKSNIVEALRWTMGESSARALRGGESDDLIFAGTGARPSRNVAKVTLSLDHAQGLAPAPFEESDELNISRQAERGRGSTYRINGQTMRARDVQTIFADLSSGARSSSIISQNRVSQLIAAKPEERRALLEEAAGITGLYARRRDAELKLRQSESNLERAEDRRQQLTEQLDVLEDQSTHARHYRSLSEKIRESELLLLTAQHARAQKSIQQHQKNLSQIQDKLHKTEAQVRDAEKYSAEQKEKEESYQHHIETLRPAIEELRVSIQVAQKSLEHSQKTEQETAERLAQIGNDLQRQKNTRDQLTARKDALVSEINTLKEKEALFPEKQETLREELERLSHEQADKQRSYDELTAQYNKEYLQHETLKSQLKDRNQQLKKERTALQELENEHEKIHQKQADFPSLHHASQQAKEARDQAQHAQRKLQEAQSSHQECVVEAKLAAQALKQAGEQEKQLKTRLHGVKSHLEKLEERRQSDATQRQILTDSLLSDEQKHLMEHTIRDAKKTTKEAEEREKTLFQKKEQVEQEWLTKRAGHEEWQRKHTALTEEIERLTHALPQQEKRYQHALDAIEKMNQEPLSAHDVEQAESNFSSLEKELSSHNKTLSKAQNELTQAQRHAEKIRQEVMRREAELAQLQGECEGLRQSLGANETQTPDPVIDHIQVPEELTRALACALTEGLEASLSPLPLPPSSNHETLRYWRDLPILSADGVASLHPLSAYMTAPKVLSRALSSVFLVDDPKQGETLQSQLAPGQSLVSREGHVWRWDGFVRSHKAPSAETIRLEQQQRLRSLEKEIKTIKTALTEAQEKFTTSQKTLVSCRTHVATLTRQHQQLKESHGKAHLQAQELSRRFSFHQERLTLAHEQLEEQKNALQSLKEQRQHQENALTHFPKQPHDALRLAEEATHSIQEQARQARDAYQKRQEELHKAERSYEQALLTHKTTQERLTELKLSDQRLSQEIRSQQGEHNELLEEQKRLDASTFHTRVEQGDSSLSEAAAQLQQAEQAYKEAQQHADQLTQHYTQLERELTALNTQSDTIGQRIETQKKTLSHSEEQTTRLEQEAMSLPVLENTQRAVTEAQQALETVRTHVQKMHQQHAQLKQEEQSCHAHYEALQQQHKMLEETLDHLHEEETALLQRQKELLPSPENSENSQTALEKNITLSSEKLTKLEEKMEQNRNALEALRKDKDQHSAHRQHDHQQRAQYAAEVIRIKERLEQAYSAYDTLRHNAPLPEKSPTLTDVTAQAEQQFRRNVRRFTQEREALGPVNLCAEEEFQKARNESDHLLKEHTELTTAIARLRGGIGAINRQGRSKLTTIFTEINQHFQSLFERMFGGGKAHLAMVGSDDPLDAGLEIFAQPPGKKLSTLSLLSGGEQALTALSLIFAAFHCTPAPICVLDEVDAPLDDANIERFCHLLTDMTKQTKTRFLVVTHHQLTMAHMDRLFGVTMQERGVSRLLSVNLDESIKMANG